MKKLPRGIIHIYTCADLGYPIKEAYLMTKDFRCTNKRIETLIRLNTELLAKYYGRHTEIEKYLNTYLDRLEAVYEIKVDDFGRPVNRVNESRQAMLFRCTMALKTGRKQII